jgi:hypothetical protein
MICITSECNSSDVYSNMQQKVSAIALSNVHSKLCKYVCRVVQHIVILQTQYQCKLYSSILQQLLKEHDASTYAQHLSLCVMTNNVNTMHNVPHQQ